MQDPASAREQQTAGRVLALAAITLVLLAAPAARGQCRYEAVVIQPPSCPLWGPMPGTGAGLNEGAMVVGWYDDCDGNDLACTWTAESGLQPIPFPFPVNRSRSWAVNDSGVVTGEMDRPGPGWTAFVYDGAKVIDLGTMPGGNFSEGLSINAAGDIVGVWGNNATGPPIRPFLWARGRMIDLGLDIGLEKGRAYDVNDRGEVTGWAGSHAVTDAFAFIWHDGDVTLLPPIPGGITSEGRAINDRGEVVGVGRRIDNPFTDRAFLWRNGAMQIIEPLPGHGETLGIDINNLGQVIGWLKAPSDTFLWQNGSMHVVNDLLAEDAVGLDVISVRSINDLGQIAGTTHSDQLVLLTPVDRPATDLDADCRTGAMDLALLLENWSRNDPLFDIDGDGIVGMADLLMLLAEWG